MIALRMKELRKALGLSMPEFGRRLGCSRDVIANIEYGRVKPKEVLLEHVCDVYGVNRGWLYGGRGPMFLQGAGYDESRKAMELYRSLSSELRVIALSQLQSLHRLMEESAAKQKNNVSNRLDTVRLMAALHEAHAYEDVKSQPDATAVGDFLHEKLGRQKMSRGQLVKDGMLCAEELDGMLASQGNIRRDALVAAGLALSLDADEIQRLLTAAGLPALYAKNQRDAACLFAFIKKLSVPELNELLAGLGEAPL